MVDKKNRLRPRFSWSPGRVSPGGVLMVMILVGLALVAGWWYGQRSPSLSQILPPAREKKETPKPKLPPPRLPQNQEGDSADKMILEDRLADVAERAMPAVVNVFSEKVYQTRSVPFFFFGPGPWGVPRERRERSLGSGVIVSEDGYILTNNHLVESASSIMVALSDNREFPAQVVGTDPGTDLAVLKIKADDLPVLPLGDSDQVRVGQVVLAIGNPFGLSQTVTMGIVSARGRSNVGITDFEDFIQTDAAINPGNSGGALINLRGELIGINTAIYSRTGGNLGIGFAIPSNLARQIMKSLVETGTVSRGFLGVGIQEVTPELAQQFGLSSPQGVLVNEVLKGSAAEKAGLAVEDIILSVNGKEIKGPSDFINRIAQLTPGTKVTLEVMREERRITITATLTERPEPGGLGRVRPGGPPDSEDREAEFAGMKVVKLTPQLADQLDIEGDLSGLAVVDVAPDSRADRAGVMVGDVILTINRTQVNTVSEFKAVARRLNNQPALLHLRRHGQNFFLVIPRT